MWSFLGFLFAVLLFIRFPFFFRDAIDYDESTFILVGQAWADGHLPYTKLWDLKPPLTFGFFALVLNVFGKSLWAIRLMGVLVIWSTCASLFWTGRRIKDAKVGMFAATLYAVLSSLFDTKQGVMSEHLCMLPFCWGLYYLIVSKNGWNYLLSGCLFGLALMTKLNIAYAVLFTGLGAMIFVFIRQGFLRLLAYGSIWTLGLVSPIVALWLPYISEGLSQVFVNSVFTASLQYADSTPFFNKALYIAFVLWVLLSIKLYRTANISAHKQLILIYLAICGILYSYASAGKINGHYLIQLFAILPLFLGYFYAGYSPSIHPRYRIALPIVLLAMCAEPLVEYYTLTNHYLKEKYWTNGEAYEVSRYCLQNYQMDTTEVLFTSYHIGYWLLGKYPPSPVVTHPSNLKRDYNYPFMGTESKSSMEELKSILQEKPDLIVTKDGHLYFVDKTHDLNQYFSTFLAEHYREAYSSGRAVVFALLPGH